MDYAHQSSGCRLNEERHRGVSIMSFMKHPFPLLLLAASMAYGEEAPVPAKIEFNRDVRPILSDN